MTQRRWWMGRTRRTSTRALFLPCAVRLSPRPHRAAAAAAAAAVPPPPPPLAPPALDLGGMPPPLQSSTVPCSPPRHRCRRATWSASTPCAPPANPRMTAASPRPTRSTARRGSCTPSGPPPGTPGPTAGRSASRCPPTAAPERRPAAAPCPRCADSSLRWCRSTCCSSTAWHRPPSPHRRRTPRGSEARARPECPTR